MKTIKPLVTIIFLLSAFACIPQAHNAEPRPGVAQSQASIIKYDEYSDLTPADEEARLKTFANQLQSDPQARAYVFVYSGRRVNISRLNEGQVKAESVKNYLMEELQINGDRIAAFNIGRRESLTVELYLYKDTQAWPSIISTVTNEQVEFVDAQLRPLKTILKSTQETIDSVLKPVEVVYPPIAHMARVGDAEISVRIIIGEDGNVIETLPLNGHPLLRAAAAKATRGWKFKPTLSEGKPSKVDGSVIISFKMPPPLKFN